MYPHDKIPIGIFHVLEADVTKDTSIVDEDIDSSESLDGSIDDLITKLDAVVIGNGLSSSFLDFVHDDISSLVLQLALSSSALEKVTHLV
jgi:hypothetical protein